MNKSLLKIGAMAAILGSIGSIVANVLHPRLPIGDSVAHLTGIAQTGNWVLDHLLILVFFLLMVAGLVIIYRTMSGPGTEGWVELAYFNAVVAAATLAVLIGIDGFALKFLADSWMSAEGPAKEIAFSAGQAMDKLDVGVFAVYMLTFFGTAPILSGILVLTGKAHGAMARLDSNPCRTFWRMGRDFYVYDRRVSEASAQCILDRIHALGPGSRHSDLA